MVQREREERGGRGESENTGHRYIQEEQSYALKDLRLLVCVSYVCEAYVIVSIDGFYSLTFAVNFIQYLLLIYQNFQVKLP